MGSANSFSIFALTKSGPLSFFSMVSTSKLIASFLERQYCLMCKPNSFHNRLYVLFSFGYVLFSFGYTLFSFGCASFTFRYVIIASTITKQQKSVKTHGIPSRVRSDKGKENVLVADYMIEKRGSERGSVNTGPSTHNQRIEHFWRDVFDGVLELYYELFTLWKAMNC